MFRIINQNFALRVNKRLGDVVTKEELKQFFGEYVDIRIKQKLNIFFVHANQPTKHNKYGGNRDQSDQASQDESQDGGKQGSRRSKSNGDSDTSGN